MENSESFSCPFCGFETFLESRIVQHIEIIHPESPNSPSDIKITDEPIPTDNIMEFEHSSRRSAGGCGNFLCVTEMDSNISIMSQEQKHLNDFSMDLKIKKEAEVESFQTKAPPNKYTLHKKDRTSSKKVECIDQNPSSNSVHNKHQGSSVFNSVLEKSTLRKVKRLGKSELGPHMYEAKMPERLAKLLREEDGAMKIVIKIVNGKLKEIEICHNMMPGIIPVIKQLISSDKSTQYAYLCDPSVKHVSRLKKEGGFCGYRNIQMMISYIISTKSQGHEAFRDKIPTIFEIQDHIEMAWDMGINSYGRIETNGIRGTRKYIGTPEAYTMFCGLGIACDVEAIITSKIQNKLAYEILFGKVEEYFSKQSTDSKSRVRCTNLPPIYLQHSGHSMTIVGFERKKNDKKNLIVFDPKHCDLTKIMKLVDPAPFNDMSSENLLKPYRIDINYLKKYNEFELLKLSGIRNRIS